MGRKRAIICFETEERFESVTDAANAIGAAWSLVSSALKRHGACRGFHFYYADEAEPDDSVFDRKVYKNSRPIICLETNERFESQARAAKAVGVPREAIYAALRGHIATNPFVRHAPVKTTEEVFRFFANGYRREHGAEPEVTGNRKPSERDILSGMGAVSARVDS